MQTLSLLLLTLCLLSSCNEAVDSPDFNDGAGGQDNISPDPSPTPRPNPTPIPEPTIEQRTLNFSASDLNPEEARMVYKKRIKPTQLASSSDDEDCHPNYKDRCVKDRQVLFQFNIEELNSRYPTALWEITEFKLKASYFSTSGDISEELLCLLNRKVCSGVEISKLGGIRLPFLWRNSKFWTGQKAEHIVGKDFDQLLRSQINSDGVAVAFDTIFDLIKVFKLSEKALLTTIRKNSGLHFSVSSDTYVEDPELIISIRRRQLSE